MDYVFRSVERGRWESKGYLPAEDVSTDALKDLDVRDGKLSFWSGDSSEDGIKEIVLAIASGWTRPDKIDLAWIEISAVNKIGIEVEETQGRTPVPDLRERHRNAVQLDVSRLASLCIEIAKSIRQSSYTTRLTKTQVKKLLRDAVASGRLPKAEMDAELLQKLDLR